MMAGGSSSTAGKCPSVTTKRYRGKRPAPLPPHSSTSSTCEGKARMEESASRRGVWHQACRKAAGAGPLEASVPVLGEKQSITQSEIRGIIARFACQHKRRRSPRPLLPVPHQKNKNVRPASGHRKHRRVLARKLERHALSADGKLTTHMTSKPDRPDAHGNEAQAKIVKRRVGREGIE